MPRGSMSGRKSDRKRARKKKRDVTPSPSSMLGSGLMGKAAKSMRKRRQMLRDL